MEKKKCIFCGKISNEMNWEHIIPKWLIKKTGHINRIITFSYYDKSKFTTLKIPFSKFKFRSCAECNKIFSELEIKCSLIIDSLNENKPLSKNDLNILLDWFDKIRVGLWLGYLRFANLSIISPKFYITKRMHGSDRFLFIYRIENISHGINFLNISTPIFCLMPSVFGFRINNYYFINGSENFILSKQFGLPYIKKILNFNNNSFEGIIVEGDENIKNKIFNINYYNNCIELYQPLAPLIIENKYPEIFEKTYVKNILRNNNIYIKINNKLELYPDKKVTLWIPKNSISPIEINDIHKTILKFQIYLYRNGFEKKIPSIQKEEEKLFKLNIDINNLLIKKKVVKRDPVNPNHIIDNL